MGKDIVMLHGASAGGWCFDKFREVFEGQGWTVHTPDLIGHNLRTALIGADGRIVKFYTGSDWTPGAVLADLRTALRQS